MKFIFNTIFFMFCILIIIAILDILRSGTISANQKLQSEIESAYFEGQKDALCGDIRIKKNNDSCWIWTKSCWNNGKTPIFNPSIVCNGIK